MGVAVATSPRLELFPLQAQVESAHFIDDTCTAVQYIIVMGSALCYTLRSHIPHYCYIHSSRTRTASFYPVERHDRRRNAVVEFLAPGVLASTNEGTLFAVLGDVRHQRLRSNPSRSSHLT
ncbi:hypothetical protein J6590_033746 [Homalodisca vitripennis]|nr:hypothetical protein J6590_033746 [Homalodisca vitripennis]